MLQVLEKLLVTGGLPQVWLDGSTIGGFAKPNFSPGRTSNFELQILTSTKQFQSAAAPADGILFPHLRQALIVSRYQSSLQMETVQNSYPMLLIPQKVSDILSNGIKHYEKSQVLNILGEPPKPPPNPTQPHFSSIEPNEFNEHTNAIWTCIIFLSLIGLFLLIYLNANNYNEFSVLASKFIYGPIILIIFLVLLRKIAAHADDKENKKLLKAKYSQEKIKFEEELKEFERKQKVFNQQAELYRKKKHEYDERKQILISSFEFQNNIKNKTVEILEAQINDFAKFVQMPAPSTIDCQSGISEEYFLGYLKKYFKNLTIKRNYSLNFYQPDFTLILENDLCIDIEIDEPYSGNSKECIHYYNYNTNTFSDSKRNDYFLKNNWIIIRFSEKQIFQQPDSCCKYLAGILNILCYPVNMSMFKNILDITNEKIWDKKQADEMAYFDMRKEYIPKRR